MGKERTKKKATVAWSWQLVGGVAVEGRALCAIKGGSKHECEQTPGDSEGQGSLACCSPWGY